MEPRRWARLDELFAAAEPLPADQRRALFDASFSAEPDPELRSELEALLAAADGPAAGRVDGAIAHGLRSFAEGKKVGGLAGLRDGELTELEKPPTRVGSYLILGEIGRGGMATVYAAERDDREFERKVAVKILRRGMDTADIVRRLRRERQILASLDHPNIARLLDGGTTDDGRPFVVMEYIDGEPIDFYCEKKGLGLAARLQLFRQICDAVHFAHRNLILHRDIKPSNILVTAEGIPKLLDFGIAKVLAGGELTGSELPEPTLTGWRLFTPEWASPEQVRGETLTTASDVYSLGLLLYLLVTGRRAYTVDLYRPAELERVVCEQDPPSPGRGDDLDVVILAALRKEPARRYASAEPLAEDVRRFLENLPVTARKDTPLYRSGKFVRRHRLAVAAVTAVFLTLLLAALVTFRQARLADEQRRQAEANLERAEQVATFLTDIFEVSSPDEARGRDLRAREVLDQGVRRIRFSLQGDPQLRAELLGTMGRVYQKLNQYDEAAALLEEAWRLKAQTTGESSVATAASRRDLAALAFERGQLEQARDWAAQALAQQRSASGSSPLEIAQSLKLVADIEVAFDAFDQAEALLCEALSLETTHLGAEAEQVLATRNSLGEMYFRQGKTAEALTLFEDVLAVRRRVLGGDHPELATSINNLAVAAQTMGDLAKARVLLLEVLAIRRRVFGEEHHEVALTLNNLAAVEGEINQLPEAIAHMQEAMAINTRLHGENHPILADHQHNLGFFYQKLGQLDRARALYGEALARRRTAYGEKHPLVAQTLRNLGDLEEEIEPARAEMRFREALQIDRQVLPENDPRIANSLSGLGRLAAKRGALAEAETWFREELAIRGSTAANWRRFYAEGWLGRVLFLTDRKEAALPLLEGAARELVSTLGKDHPRTRQIVGFLELARKSGV